MSPSVTYPNAEEPDGRCVAIAPKQSSAFLQVFGKRGKQRSHGNAPLVPQRPAVVNPISSEEVREACLAHNRKGSQDMYGITPTVLAVAAKSDLFCSCLAQLITECMKKAKVPTRWKQCCISPLPKPQKDLLLCESYRPVTIFSLVARTADRVSDCRVKSLWKPHKDQLGYESSRSRWWRSV